MITGRDGLIGGEHATIGRSRVDRLVLAWRGREFDLERELVRHRDEDGRVGFSVADESIAYRRAGPSAEDIRLAAIDFTADEPWTWEDSDFGLFVFHVATGTGPIKYRHLVQAAEEGRRARSTWPPQVSATEIRRDRVNARSERAAFAELTEVRAKFEISGIWSDLTILTLEAPGALVVVPIGVLDRDRDWVRDPLAPRLARLPGWSGGAAAALERALEYSGRRVIGPARGETPAEWAESPIWSRAAVR